MMEEEYISSLNLEEKVNDEKVEENIIINDQIEIVNNNNNNNNDNIEENIIKINDNIIDENKENLLKSLEYYDKALKIIKKNDNKSENYITNNKFVFLFYKFSTRKNFPHDISKLSKQLTNNIKRILKYNIIIEHDELSNSYTKYIFKEKELDINIIKFCIELKNNLIQKLNNIYFENDKIILYYKNIQFKFLYSSYIRKNKNDDLEENTNLSSSSSSSSSNSNTTANLTHLSPQKLYENAIEYHNKPENHTIYDSVSDTKDVIIYWSLDGKKKRNRYPSYLHTAADSIHLNSSFHKYKCDTNDYSSSVLAYTFDNNDSDEHLLEFAYNIKNFIRDLLINKENNVFKNEKIATFYMNIEFSYIKN